MSSTGSHALTAAAAGLVSCHACHKLWKPARTPAGSRASCGRCGATLHRRKPNSIARTSALLTAAAILYVPANVYPVMTVTFMGKGEPDTLLSGVEHLFAAGSWAVASLVFFASIVVPVLKLASLSFLVISVQLRWTWRPKDRTGIYRMAEFVGRWSMLDIFMISILVALVKLGALATIEAGIGATAFAAVVILTMFAASSFDPRLIWDSLEQDSLEVAT